MRKLTIVVAVLLSLVVGCTSGDDDTTEAVTEDTDTTAPAAIDDPRAPGVTADSIKIGITYPDLEAVRQYTTADHGDYEAAYQALIDDINRRGGIHGRKIEPIYEAINAIGTAPAEAACVKLTEDDDVFAAVGFMPRDIVLCYIEAHETAAIGGNMSPERQRRAKAPWIGLEQSADQEADVIRKMAEAGVLDGKLAVFAGVTDGPAMNDTVLPLLDELGIEPVSTAVLSAPIGDVPAQNAATAVVAEKFRSAGATKVLVVGDAGITWASGTEKTGYRPKVLFTKGEIIRGWYKDDAGGHDLSVLDGAVLGDVYGPLAAEYDVPSMQKCMAIQEKAGVVIPDPEQIPDGDPIGQFESTRRACKAIAVLSAVLEDAGKDLDYGTFRTAAENLGEFDMPGSPEPYSFGPGSSLDGDAPVYLYDWRPGERDFVRREG